ncbi:non-ribosomal peptide synthetase [Paracidovorax cattleyae]|uniref:Amino acid adenylation domain-containing protein n=2 Tax=Paracidovorax cattleyae TaxID=80868 RepID=A0A1H0L3B1_9BURK|nr:non-ribosomal peptide synthetase [Paracidovorax cattleyae]SDO62460.1 amino acid adenylation domain-containing protein [Paracidovorax cattleyae]
MNAKDLALSAALDAEAAAPRNFVERLRTLAEEQPDTVWLTVVDEPRGGRREVALTYAEFTRRVHALAARLQQRFAPGDRALVLQDNDEHYAASMLACFHSGIVAVPVFPPESQRPQHLARLQGIARDCGAACVLTTTEWEAMVRAGFPGLEVIAGDAVDLALAGAWRAHEPADDDLAFLQYTSGSTGHPKGVMVTHGNLMANERAIQEGMATGPEDRFVSWAPLFHDMGLIGGLLQPLYCGASLVLVSPRYFLERPARWLELVSRHRATVSGGPDFSYRLCLERISDAQAQGLDLSHWRVAYSGAEPVRADTMAAFAERFAAQGFRAGAVHACYGLAEATLYVTGARPGQGLWARGFSAQALAVGAAEPDDAGTGPLLVGCGGPASGHAVQIMDVASLAPADAGGVGEVWACGPSVAAGYWGQPEATAATFVEHGGRRWLRTGDLGFLHDGQLVVTGRTKDLIILRGHNVYPQDVERAIEAEVEAVRKGRVAVFPVQGAQAEGIGAAVEVSRGMQKLVPPQALVEALSAAVSEAVGEPLSVVLLLQPGTLPKTTSGKLQRSACRAAWAERSADAYAIHEWGRFVRGGGQEEEATSSGGALDALEAEVAGIWQDVLRTAASQALDRSSHFFVLGGNSLAATQAAARIAQRFGVAFAPRVLFDHPRLGACVEALRATMAAGPAGSAGASAVASAVEPLPPALRGGNRPLSHAQARQWFLWKLAPAEAAYHVGAALWIDGAFDTVAAQAALEDVARRQASLRTVFGEGPDGVPFQRVEEMPAIAFEAADLGRTACSERDDAVRERLDALKSRPFDLLQGPPWRVALLSLDARTHVLAVVMHHILSDGASMQLWAAEWLEAYGARRQGLAARGMPQLQYIDYAAWAAGRLEAGEGERQWAWWQERLADWHATPCEVRPDQSRPPRASYTARRHAFEVPAAVVQGLRALQAREGATSFMVLLAALQVLLSRYTGQPRVRVGAAVAQRGVPGVDGLIGLFVNTLVLPGTVGPQATLLGVLRDAREMVLGAQAHQELPFDRLVEALRPERSAGASPLFQVMLNHLAEDERLLQAVPGLAVRAEPLQGPQAQFELVLEARERGTGALSLTWVHAAELFEPATIERLAGHFLALLQAMAEHPEQPAGAVEWLAPAERAQLDAWGRNDHRESPPVPVFRQLEAHAARQPQATALLFGDEAIGYGELNARANRLAHHLLRRGLQPQSLVGICMQRSTEMIVGMLAAMKAGCAYLPLDPELPAGRLGDMLEHSGAAWVLSHAATAGQVPALPGVRVIGVEGQGDLPGAVPGDAENPGIAVHGEQLAYVIYTSGSTGRPKGVAVRHAALHTCMAWMQGTYGLAASDTVLHKAPFGFDVSCWEIFWPLTAGARLLVAPPGAHRDPEHIVQLIERHQVTTLNFVPSMLRAFLDHPGIEHRTRLRHVICGGEAMPETLQREALRRLPGATLQNLYGPTETTIHVTRWTCRDEAGPVPIGRPISETQAWVLDAQLQPVPQGVAGELYIGGALLARGYLGQPGLTAERFVADPQGAGGRLYRTGDWVRWNAEGQIEYLGRIDHQVKLRGLRIELGEIESALRAQAGVKDSVAVVRGAAGAESLVAYVAGAGDAVALRAALAQRLPGYMVPRAIVVLDALPLNANGKVDRAALPDPAPAGGTGSGEPAAPQGSTAHRLATLWSELLGVPSVGLQDNFFDLGGHSLLLVRTHRRLEDEWGCRLALVDLFQHPTVESLARRIDLAAGESEGEGGPAHSGASAASQFADDRARRQRAALLQRRAHLQGGRE